MRSGIKRWFTRRHGAILTCGLFLPATAGAQAGAGSPPTAPTGTQAVESVVIAYDATGELAREIAKRGCPQDGNAIKAFSNNFLLGTPANLGAIQTYISFETARAQLASEYHVLEITLARSQPPASARAEISEGASAAITAVTGAVSALKTQTTQSATTFTPVDQVLISDLEKGMAQGGCNLVTTAYPGQIGAAAAAIQADLQSLLNIRHAAQQARHSDTEAGYKADLELQALDAQQFALQQSVGNESATSVGPAIIAGKALLLALSPNYHVLTIANAAAGGGIRANNYFLLNVILPAPHPSYNGGAAVAYSLRSMSGVFEDSDTLYFVYGYTKWKEPPRRRTNGETFANFGWDNSGNRGHWQPIY